MPSWFPLSVRSFGTENRPTDRPVAPRDEVYEYIIFRGSDIKDIRFVEPPKPQPTLQGGLPNDPAILQVQNGTFCIPKILNFTQSCLFQHSAPDGPGAPGSGRHPSGGSQPGGTGPPGQQQGGQAPQVGFGPIGSSSSLGGPGPNSTASSGFSAPGGAPFSAAPGAPVSGGPGGASSEFSRQQPQHPDTTLSAPSSTAATRPTPEASSASLTQPPLYGSSSNTYGILAEASIPNPSSFSGAPPAPFSYSVPPPQQYSFVASLPPRPPTEKQLPAVDQSDDNSHSKKLRSFPKTTH